MFAAIGGASAPGHKQTSSSKQQSVGDPAQNGHHSDWNLKHKLSVVSRTRNQHHLRVSGPTR